ncbi:MAG: tetratricopeptide repeat protein [Robiginitalea sp.]
MNAFLRKSCFFIFILHAMVVFGQPEALFEKATQAYNQGNYDEALSYYQEVLDTGSHSAALCTAIKSK